MRRGDLVTVALQGEQGKPRPALVVQADRFAELPAVTELPITGTLIDAQAGTGIRASGRHGHGRREPGFGAVQGLA